MVLDSGFRGVIEGSWLPSQLWVVLCSPREGLTSASPESQYITAKSYTVAEDPAWKDPFIIRSEL